MAAFWALFRRELAGFFVSMTGYIIIAAVLFFLGFSFTELLESLNVEPTHVPVTELFYNTWYFWLIMLLSAPVITMRSFALEKSSGTYETLATAPVTEQQMVLAKFAGALVFFFVMWLPLAACVLLTRYYTNDPGGLTWGALLGTYVGIILIGGVFLSIGCLTSVLTRSQIVSAIVSFVLCCSLFVLGLRAVFDVGDTQLNAQLLSYISMVEHMQDFVRGVIDTRYVVLYLTLIVFLIFMTIKVLESRRWR
ncbi:MAG: ABC transporter permease subunit [Verrucomicrobia bacterium]|nr:ABC transporter permease subunit [Verrucomicrobiota bacterium]